jgi:hypothetical protein
LPENGTVARGANPSTPIIKGGNATSQVTTPNADTGSPISPTPAVSAKQAKTSMADEVKHPALRTNASPATTSVDEEATVRRSSRKRPTSEALSQRPHPTRKKTRGVEGRRLDVDLEAQEEKNEEPRTTGEDEGATCYVLTTSFDDSMSQKIANVSSLLISASRSRCSSHSLLTSPQSDGETTRRRGTRRSQGCL